ncbi:MAG: putative Co/Zn/Cd efflux system rane fusion protein [Myxococcaceae bacterium]|jgi:multidrug efflux system membrane fusion protein|nr:putative Co/Zn/Cd efflux system rane fusion protein [Myxococcaceae bacterium]
MTRSTRVIVAILVVVVLAGAALFVRGRSARAGAKPSASGAPGGSGAAPGGPANGPPADRVVPVATAIATRKDVPVIVEGLGTVTPLATVTVKTQVDGRLDRVLFTEGQAVKKGEVIALVDQRPFTIQLHTAEATLAKDDSQLKNGQLNLDRYETLRKGNLIPQQQVDDQRALVAQLDATTRADKAQVENARLLLDYARITSPIDGVTGLRQVDPGNLVHASDANGIVLITQVDPIAVIFTLPQDDLPRVQRAMKDGKVAVDAFARDGIQKLGTGELLLVDNQVNAQTATIRLKSVVPNADHVLWPNAFVKARMHLTTVKGALVVPASVVQRGPSGTFAYVVSNDRTVSPRPVEVASIEGDIALIAKGLSEGDVVVTDGQNQLKPGSKVSARPPSAVTAAASSSAGTSAKAMP